MPANPLNLGGVVGIDNIAPIYNPYDRWQTWNINEIYTGTIGQGKFVPKIDDVVFEIAGNSIIRYIVRDIDPTTMVASLQLEVPSNTDPMSPEDIIFGIGVSTPSETYRVYVDTSVMPHTLTIDARNKIYGSMSNACKIFKGTDTSNSGIVISRMYDTNNNFLGENIPLEVVAYDNLNNVSIKVVAPGYTTATLNDGEIVTAVIYNAQGGVVSRRQMLIANTAFIRSPDAGIKYVTGISLRSPFMSPTNNRLIQYPVNVPLNGLNLVGRVNYSDGSYKEYPVDNNRFSIYGFDGYLATVVGQHINLVLKYDLLPTEVSYSVTSTIGSTQISEQYEAITMNVDGSYSLKLYGYPVWIDDVNGYRLDWFMYNMDRNIKYNVTPYVTINTDLGAFNPTLYGTVQNLNVSLNIQNVNGAYKNYIHSQTISVVLNKRGSERPNNWTVGFSPDQQPRYGADIYATAYFINTNQWRVRLGSNAVDLDDWLEKTYLRTQPLYDTMLEESVVAPNMFALVIGNVTTEYPISDWDSDLTIAGSIQNSSTAYVRFFKRTPDTDLELSIAGLPVYYVDVNNSII